MVVPVELFIFFVSVTGHTLYLQYFVTVYYIFFSFFKAKVLMTKTMNFNEKKKWIISWSPIEAGSGPKPITDYHDSQNSTNNTCGTISLLYFSLFFS